MPATSAGMTSRESCVLVQAYFVRARRAKMLLNANE
jgi:hypothetical protein